MDFSFSSDQEELRALTNRVLTDRCTMEHLKEVEDVGGIDLVLWRELADLGIVGDVHKVLPALIEALKAR